MTRTTRTILLIGAASLGARLAFAPWTDFSIDEQEVYRLGLDFHLKGVLSTTAAGVSKSDAKVPGSLLPLLAGLPLRLSGGLPRGAAWAVAWWNFCAVCLIYVLYRGLFPELPAVPLAGFIFFAPWPIVYASMWVPNWTPVFSALFFLGLARMFRRPRDVMGAFLAGFGATAALQVHLSAVLLPALAAVLLVLGVLAAPSVPGALGGCLAGAVTLVPYLVAPTPAANAGGVLLPSVGFHPGNLLMLPSILVRFLSFATGEASRTFTYDRWDVALAIARAQPWLLLPGAVGLAGSAWVFWQGLKFFADRGRWSALRRRGRRTPRERMDALALAAPLAAGGLFLFCRLRPAARTLWILMPLSYYPALRTVAGAGRIPRRWAIALYVTCAAVFAVFGYAYSPHLTHLRDVEAAAFRTYPPRGNAVRLLPVPLSSGVALIHEALAARAAGAPSVP